jgi:hypothetical protein
LLTALIIGAVLASVGGKRRALAGLGVVALIVSIKGAFYVRASEVERRTAGTAAAHVEAVFGSWSRWSEIQIGADTLEQWSVDAGQPRATSSAAVARKLDLPLVGRSRALPTVANLLASHDDTFARVVSAPGGGYEVRWSALRYCRVERDGSEPVCGLWFGGEYDAGGRPVAAIVRIGTIVQRRAAGRTASDNQ